MNTYNLKSRFLIANIFILIIALVFLSRLFFLQVVKGNYYKEASEKRLLRSMPIKAPRGEIFDRNGKPLVTNKMGFSVIIQKMSPSQEELNSTIYNLLNILKAEGKSFSDTLPLSMPPFDFIFSSSETENLSEIQKNWKKSRNIPINYSASETISFFKAKYKIDQKLNDEDTRKIIGVRFEMENRGFSLTNPFTFAVGVSVDTITKIKEMSFDFKGVDISVEPIRERPNTELAAHILGRVGSIYKEEYEKLKSKNYGMNDIIGKDGMEKYLEEYLKGKDGISSIEQDFDGKVTRIINSKKPLSGNFAVLTIDAELQRVAEESLKKNIENIKAFSGGNKKEGADAAGGAVVVLDVHSGEVLALASYPTYNLDKFNEDYSKLIKDPLKPMFNRTISGAYAPGSTYKMVTAIAGLEENVITPKDVIVDEGIYKFYAPTYTPKCWIFDQFGKTHGAVNVSGALKGSCNYFFYDVGRRLTIENINKYSRMFGLGEISGIELSGENKGILASPEYRTKTKQKWYPGDTLQAAIGQSDNMFTPLQIANYIATIANGKERYKPHLLKEIRSYTSDKPILTVNPTVLNKIDLNKQNYLAVMEGMKSVTEDGTASSVFANFPISVGGKTGSAQAPGGVANGLFVAFAPYENPQISIAVVVERAAHGNSVAPIARDIIEAYFLPKNQDNQNIQDGGKNEQ